MNTEEARAWIINRRLTWRALAAAYRADRQRAARGEPARLPDAALTTIDLALAAGPRRISNQHPGGAK